MRVFASLLAFVSVLVSATTVFAVPGPDSVAVVANANDPESVALAEAYAQAREIPLRQLCQLDLPTTFDISLSDYDTRFATPFAACLTSAGVLERIEAVVLARGVPLRVVVPTPDGDEIASLAAVLGVWRSQAGGAPLVGQAPGHAGDCGGTPCRAAAWRNPFERQRVFSAGWTRDVGGVSWHPLLVTMLHGRTYADARRLITSALEGDRLHGASGRFLLMNGADPARGALDSEYAGVLTALARAGVSDAARVPFDAELEGQTLAAFVTGTASLGRAIEGNTFAPGALTDNLTSFGAVPQNFDATGESQVSIARWVSMGVAGAHGTVDEPLNNCFPSRYLLVDYADGSTLGEAYHRRLPYVYWKNLVLGDPITAPYATRPTVVLEGVSGGDTLVGARRVTVRATDALLRQIGSLALFVDGVEVARAAGDTLEACVVLAEGADVQLLAVAQIAYDEAAPVDTAYFQPKGWTAVRVSGASGPTTCSADLDAGLALDGSALDRDGAVLDAGIARPVSADGGCGCAIARANHDAHVGLGLVFALVALVCRRRRAVGSRG